MIAMPGGILTLDQTLRLENGVVAPESDGRASWKIGLLECLLRRRSMLGWDDLGRIKTSFRADCRLRSWAVFILIGCSGICASPSRRHRGDRRSR
jgi:hypothetical protein